MGIRTTSIEPHWNYLLALERDLERISRFVEFDERNFKCFSIEIARVLLAAGAEVDVVAKQVCRNIRANSTAENINAYRDEITSGYPKIPTFSVLLPRFGLTLTPWENWTDPQGVPIWWTAYNKTKHERHSQYHQANLKNAINSVAGLFVLAIYLYKSKAERGELLPTPQMIRPGAEHVSGSTFSETEFGLNYSF